MSKVLTLEQAQTMATRIKSEIDKATSNSTVEEASSEEVTQMLDTVFGE